MAQIDPVRVEACKRIYEMMQAGCSQNEACCVAGRSSSWVSRWLPAYLHDDGDLDLNNASQKAIEDEVERLRRIIGDLYSAANKVSSLFSKTWRARELSDVDWDRRGLLNSLYKARKRLEERRRELLKLSRTRGARRGSSRK